jgi:asparagine synthase (glutamine-hydrolysing)
MLAVDRFGEKPLYYWLDEEKIVFGSEMKAIRAFPGFFPEVDAEALDEYFACGYICAPRTIYKEVRRLPGGYMLKVQRTGSAQLECYWQPEFARLGTWDKRSPADLAAELRHLLVEAVKLRMTSDVPVGAFLSGGVDSSAVVALMRKISDSPLKTFSVGFDEVRYDERACARAAADYCRAEHFTEVVRPNQVINLLPKLACHFDEPFADSSMIPTFVVAQLARQQVTVAVSGDGGDEVFAGYQQHLYGYRQRYLESVIPRRLHPAAVHAAGLLPHGVKIKPYMMALGRPAQAWLSNGFFSAAQRDRLFERTGRRNNADNVRMTESIGQLDHLSQLQYHDLTTYLPGDILVKVDRASMFASLEVRAPFLDHRVFEFMAQVPPHHRMSLTGGKALLKKALGTWLPPSARRRRKQGFSIPQAEWLRVPLQPMLRDVLLAASLPFSRPYVHALIDEHVSGRADHKDRLWALLCYELWRRT